jgi:Asp-tRNA(Asn)/Glu-tRNA(Gln) amidotransferase A subunit family amidase
VEITLTLDDDTAAQVQALAQRRQTTLADLVAELVRQANEREAGIEAYIRRTRETAGRSEPGWRFDRAEIYDRQVLR